LPGRGHRQARALPDKVADADHLANATRTPVPVLHERHLALPSAAFAGCFIGRGGAFVRRLLKQYPGVRLWLEEGAVRIIANTACVADDVLHHCQRRVTSQEATLGFPCSRTFSTCEHGVSMV